MKLNTHAAILLQRSFLSYTVFRLRKMEAGWLPAGASSRGASLGDRRGDLVGASVSIHNTKSSHLKLGVTANQGCYRRWRLIRFQAKATFGFIAR